MFGSRPARYPMLKAYLMARPRPLPAAVGSPRTQGLALAAASGTTGLAVLSSGHNFFVAGVLVATGATLAFLGLRQRKPAPPTPEQILTAEADAVVRQIEKPFEFDLTRRFSAVHRALHPAVADVLEECAGYHARVVAALDGGEWDHRADLRTSALTAANVAMDEALVLAGKSLPFTPETHPLDAIGDALQDAGLGPRRPRVVEPMPPPFRPARELAERLRELAVRCETAAQQRRETSDEPVSAAFRHLDATLGEMRRIEEAEGELRQGA